MIQYTLKFGEILTFTTETISGMAGEPMIITYLKVGSIPVKFQDVCRKMKTNDANDLGEMLDEIHETNLHAAIKFTI